MHVTNLITHSGSQNKILKTLFSTCKISTSSRFYMEGTCNMVGFHQQIASAYMYRCLVLNLLNIIYYHCDHNTGSFVTGMQYAHCLFNIQPETYGN